MKIKTGDLLLSKDTSTKNIFWQVTDIYEEKSHTDVRVQLLGVSSIQGHTFPLLSLEEYYIVLKDTNIAKILFGVKDETKSAKDSQ